ncbi:MAG: sigma-70 family RNA polymerase sigma factor [Saprospiraceae bacterium]|nr:sigma-70 family RNA polymerase sigma factor [Saprospiraceae bacterium]|tara:strand:+ start:68 stop:556 length:489 start_codon:yes stop_codon:yes gene_type:complete
MQTEDYFVKTIRKNEGIIYKITKVYASSREDQKDLYQDIIFQLWRSFDSFKGKSKLTTWIYRVALNTALAHLQKSKRSPTLLTDEFSFEMLMSPEEDKNLKEQLEIMYDQIRNLNAIEKGIILLYLEGKSHDEIAEITGYSNTNVGTRIGRVKQKLKNNKLK